MHIGRNSSQVFIRLSVAEIARAQDLLNFSRDKEFLELERQVVHAMWDVQVANDEDEDHDGDAEGPGARRRHSPGWRDLQERQRSAARDQMSGPGWTAARLPSSAAEREHLAAVSFGPPLLTRIVFRNSLLALHPPPWPTVSRKNVLR